MYSHLHMLQEVGLVGVNKIRQMLETRRIRFSLFLNLSTVARTMSGLSLIGVVVGENVGETRRSKMVSAHLNRVRRNLTLKP